MKLFLISFLFLSFTKAASADLRAYLEDTLKYNPEINRAYQNYLEFSAARYEAYAEYLPQADFTYQKFDLEIDNTADNIADNFDIEQQDLAVTQKIFEVGSIKKINSALLLRQQKKLEFHQVIADNFINVVELALELDSNLKRISFLEANLKLLNEIKKVSQLKFKNGVESNLDYLQAQTEYLAGQSELLTAQKDVQILRAEFLELTTKSYLVFEVPNSLTNIADQETFAAELLENNLELRAVELDKKISKNSAYIASKDFFPTAELFWNRSKTDGAFSFFNNNDQENTETTYGVQVSLPLFRSGATISQKVQAKRSYLAAGFTLEQIERDLQQRSVALYENIRVNKDITATRKEQLNFAEQSLTAAKTSYDIGSTDIINLLDAQRAFLEAEFQLVQAANAEKLDSYNYLYLKGQLLPQYFQIELDSIFGKTY